MHLSVSGSAQIRVKENINLMSLARAHNRVNRKNNDEHLMNGISSQVCQHLSLIPSFSQNEGKEMLTENNNTTMSLALSQNKNK